MECLSALFRAGFHIAGLGLRCVSPGLGSFSRRHFVRARPSACPRNSPEDPNARKNLASPTTSTTARTRTGQEGTDRTGRSLTSHSGTERKADKDTEDGKRSRKRTAPCVHHGRGGPDCLFSPLQYRQGRCLRGLPGHLELSEDSACHGDRLRGLSSILNASSFCFLPMDPRISFCNSWIFRQRRMPSRASSWSLRIVPSHFSRVRSVLLASLSRRSFSSL